jgi:SCO1/SenC family protein
MSPTLISNSSLWIIVAAALIGEPTGAAIYWRLLAFFEFTNCQLICPRALGKLSEVLDGLGPLADRIDACTSPWIPSEILPRQ